jgi:hypothetical protein
MEECIAEHSEAAPQSIIADTLGSSTADCLAFDYSLALQGECIYPNIQNEGYKLSESSCFGVGMDSMELDLNQSLGEKTAQGIQKAAALAKKKYVAVICAKPRGFFDVIFQGGVRQIYPYR